VNRTLRRLAVMVLFLVCLAGPGASLRVRASAPGPTTEQKAEGIEQKPAHFLLFKAINFLILVVGLGYLLRKPFREFFTGRSTSIRKGLEEGRKALEAKLQHLEEEIAAFKAAAARDMEAERERMRQAALEETEKILESARAQIEGAVRVAKLDLELYTAYQAIEQAEGMIRGRLDEQGQKRLLGQFMAHLGEGERKN
jgi:F0F1-type ATP synthase membrane subunit b/b'